MDQGTALPILFDDLARKFEVRVAARRSPSETPSSSAVRASFRPVDGVATELVGRAIRSGADARGRTWVEVDGAAVEELSGAGDPLARLVIETRDRVDQPFVRPRLVGVLNLTPDSFSDGGQLPDLESVLARAREHRDAGARVLDVGGESTRPGAAPVDEAEELRRVVEPIRALAAEGLGPISIDTRRSAVARAAIDAGAEIVNDVEAGTRDAAMLDVVAETGVTYVAMHMRGDPSTMQDAPTYDDVLDEVSTFLRARVAAALERGIGLDRVWIDPGIGFGKTLEHNLTLLSRLGELRSLGLPLFVGVSRKRFLGTLTGEREAARRVLGTASAVTACVERGADYLRVHDVGAMRGVLDVAASIRDGRPVERTEC